MNKISIHYYGNELDQTTNSFFTWLKILCKPDLAGKVYLSRDSDKVGGGKSYDSLDFNFESIKNKFGIFSFTKDELYCLFSFGTKVQTSHKFLLEYPLTDHKSSEYLRSQCLELYRLTGQSKYGAVYTYGENKQKVDKKGVAQLSMSFIGVVQPWFFVVSPKYYEGIITKEELLGAPVYKAEELENDSIAIQMWDKPYDVLSKENQEQMLRCAVYFKKIISGADFIELRKDYFKSQNLPIPELGE